LRTEAFEHGRPLNSFATAAGFFGSFGARERRKQISAASADASPGDADEAEPLNRPVLTSTASRRQPGRATPLPGAGR